jgi:predicted O-methyltransferase YrrM
MQRMAGFSEMRQLICGFSVSAATSAIAELGVADLLSAGPRSVAELAQASGADLSVLRRVMRFLASEGVFEQHEGDVFALNERSQWLKADIPGSLRPRASFVGSALNWIAWSGFLDSVRTGRSALQAASGRTLFDVVKSDPGAAATFNRFMADQTATSVEAILSAISFADVRAFVDVGGGRGALVAGVLRANASLRGTLFDLPEVIVSAGSLLDQAGVADRCRMVGGDFFEAVPSDGDLYALKFVLHDWPDAECIRILQNCARAMAVDGRVLVIEHVVPEHGGSHFARFMDMNMLALTAGGRERTQAEFAQLFAAAGLKLRRAFPTPIDMVALECVPV